MSLVFYATRTTGPDTCFDQILEFAAIRTDENLIDTDRFSAGSRLLPHIVPSPETLLTARIGIDRLNDPSLPSHYQMVRTIREKLLAWTPSTYLGYDSFAVDEHFLRQCLYQTIHSPYLTNYHGNTRADLAKIIQSSLLLAPNTITVPPSENGFQTDLPAVSSANGLFYDHAGTALATVKAMILIARQVNDNAPDLWSTAMRFSKKTAVVDFIQNEQVFCVSEFFHDKPFAWLVALIGENPSEKNQQYVFNLAVDPDDLVDLSDHDLQSRLMNFPKPVRVLKTNYAPMLVSESDAPATAAGRNLDAAELYRRADFLHSRPDLRARLVAAFTAIQQPKAKFEHVEQQIYESFIPNDDARLMERFHTSDWKDKLAIVFGFKDQRLKRLAWRLVHLEYPDAFDARKRKTRDQQVAKRLLGLQGDVPWLTLPKALNALNDCLASASADEMQLLRTYHFEFSKQLERAKAQLPASA